MSDDADESKVGYGRPPREYQFRKGQSGNPRGRPQKRKTERAFSLRQVRQDILSITEREIHVNTPEGARKMPIIRALLLAIVDKALKRHTPSQRLVYKLHSAAISQHETANKSEFEMLEQLERFVRDGDEKVEALGEHLNHRRELSRKM